MSDKRKNNTKNLVIQSTIDEISKKGYMSLSLRKIAEKNGISAAALYKHFSGKEGLFTETSIEVSKRVFMKYKLEEKNSHKNLNTQKKLILLGKNILDMFETEPYLMEFLFFSPYATRSCKYMINKKTPFPLLEEYRKLVKELARVHGQPKKEESLFVKLWSFIQGYSLLVKNKIVCYDHIFLEETLNDFIQKQED